MKKLIIPLLFVFGFFLFPINTYAESVSGSTTYYYSRCYYANGNTRCDSPDSSMTSYKSPFTSYEWTPIEDTSNYIFYLVKMQDVQISYNFQTGKVYTITLNYDHGSNIKTSSGLYLFGRSNNINCSQGACSVSWENKDDEHTTATVTFLPNNNYSSIIFGLGDSTDNNLGLFANISTVGQGLRINNAQLTSTSSSTDITPIVTEQQKTNDKLDDVNDNLDIVNDNISETNDKLDDLNDSLTDETAPTGGGGGIDFDGFRENVMSNTPITDLLTMPFTILNTLYNKIESDSCSSWEITDDFLGHDLTLPCIRPQNYFGSSLWNYIDTITSIFLVYQFAMLIISAYDSFTSLGDDFLNLYTPRHASSNTYEPKHGRG